MKTLIFAFILTFFSTVTYAEKPTKPIRVYYFTASWCKPCQQMKKNVWVDKKIREKLKKSFKLTELDYDDPKNKKYVIHYRVQFLPTIMILNDDLTVHSQVQGMQSVDELVDFLDKAD